MPLWKVYHPVGALATEDKQALADRITALYSKYMPAFYVGVIFQEVAAGSFYIGGKSHDRFVRIWIDHIAREFPNDKYARRFVDAVNDTLAPFVKERGYDWEFHIDETPFGLWSIQGHFPPTQGSADEARWMSENQASPRTHD